MNRPDLDALERTHAPGMLTYSCAPEFRDLIAYARHLEAELEKHSDKYDALYGDYMDLQDQLP